MNNFRYIGKGKAIGNVLDHNMLNVDFSADYDPDVEDAAWKSGKHWASGCSTWARRKHGRSTASRMT